MFSSASARPSRAAAVRATNAKQISGVDADIVILDEYDQMASDILPLARKRQAASQQPRLYVASTPTQPEWGINALFLESDQQRCWLPCPACGLAQRLDWDHNINAEGPALVCRQCRRPLDINAVAAWRPERPGNRLRGYHLPRLLSPRCNLARMLEDSEAVTIAEAMHFQTQDLGEAYRPEGGGLSYGELDACRSEEQHPGSVFMGVDVGKYLHVVVREYRGREYGGRMRPRRSALLCAEIVTYWHHLPQIMRYFGVDRCVIDAAPERHKGPEFADDEQYEIALAEFKHGQTTIEAVEDAWGVETLHIDRTLALDVTLQGFRDGLSLLPPSARDLGGRVKHGVGEYYREMVAPQRVFDQEREEYRYPKGHDDHFAFSELYCLMAATEIKGGMVF